MEFNINYTSRGFKTIFFKDRYSSQCSIQVSSLATEEAIWIGIDNPDPLIMASDAPKYSIATTETTGWIPYPIPQEVLISTRMHLTREQIAELLPILQKFADTGEI